MHNSQNQMYFEENQALSYYAFILKEFGSQNYKFYFSFLDYYMVSSEKR